MKLELAAAAVSPRQIPAHRSQESVSGQQEDGARTFAKLTEDEPRVAKNDDAAERPAEVTYPQPREGRENALAALAAVLEGSTALTKTSPGADEPEIKLVAIDREALAIIQTGVETGSVETDANAEPPVLRPVHQRGERVGLTTATDSNQKLQPAIAGGKAGAAEAPSAAAANAEQAEGLSRSERAKSSIEMAARAEARAEPPNPAPPGAVASSASAMAGVPQGPVTNNPVAAVAAEGNASATRGVRPDLMEAVALRRAEGGSRSIFGPDGAALQPKVIQGQNGVTNVPVGNFWQFVTTASGPSLINSLSTFPASSLSAEQPQAPQFSMQIQLHPKSLGEVSVQISRIGGTVHVNISTQTAQAERLLKSDSGNLLDAFKAADGRIEEVNLRVTTSQEGSGAGLRNGREGEREGWFGRGGFEGADTGRSGHENREHRGGELEGNDYLLDGTGDDGRGKADESRVRTGTYL